jgi:hypothetical protein
MNQAEAPVETLSPQAIKQWVKFFDVLMEVDFEVQQQERKEGDEDKRSEYLSSEAP